jgi:hypothetical protein
MEKPEIINIIAAILIMFIASAFWPALQGSLTEMPLILLYSMIIILVAIGARKLMARALDADVEHEIWKVSKFGYGPSFHFKKEIPGGIMVPLFITLFTLGRLPFLAMTILTYEAKALKRRASKRFGFYSYKEMTDEHYGLIGVAGITSMFVLAIISYLFDQELLTKLSIFYAFANMLPFSKLDGTQILIGSRIIYSVLAAITLIFFLFAITITI